MQLCQCGCGEAVKNTKCRFLYNHHSRGNKYTKGRKLNISDEQRSKLRENKLGVSPTNKLPTMIFVCQFCYGEMSLRVTSKRKFCSRKCKGLYQKFFVVPHNKGEKGIQTSWSKGFTKQTHPSLLSVSQKMIGNKRGLGNKVSHEHREILKIAMRERWHKGVYGEVNFSIGKKSYCWSETQKKTVCFRSSYELIYAKFLDKNGIKWQYEPRRFLLKDGGSYCPDFHLIDTDTWTEVKGYWYAKSRAKFISFCKEYPEILINVVGEDEIKKMKVLLEDTNYATI